MTAMNERILDPLDRFLVGINDALTTIARPASRSTRANPAADLPEADLNDHEKSHAAGLMRVNHAGEVAAQGLYQGHAATSPTDAHQRLSQHSANALQY